MLSSDTVIYPSLFAMNDISVRKTHFIWQNTSSSVISSWQVLALQSLKSSLQWHFGAVCAHLNKHYSATT